MKPSKASSAAGKEADLTLEFDFGGGMVSKPAAAPEPAVAPSSSEKNVSASSKTSPSEPGGESIRSSPAPSVPAKPAPTPVSTPKPVPAAKLEEEETEHITFSVEKGKVVVTPTAPASPSATPSLPAKKVELEKKSAEKTSAPPIFPDTKPKYHHTTSPGVFPSKSNTEAAGPKESKPTPVTPTSSTANKPAAATTSSPSGAVPSAPKAATPKSELKTEPRIESKTEPKKNEPEKKISATSLPETTPLTTRNNTMALNPPTVSDFRKNAERQAREQKAVGSLLSWVGYSLLGGIILVAALAGFGGYTMWQMIEKQNVTVAQLEAHYNDVLSKQQSDLAQMRSEIDKLNDQLAAAVNLVAKQQEQLKRTAAAADDTATSLRVRTRELNDLQNRVRRLESSRGISR